VFVSLVPDPKAYTIDAMSFLWEGMLVFEGIPKRSHANRCSFSGLG
jgi:hypothetical protein